MRVSPYRPLDSDNGEIRLLELFPAPEYSSPIECALHPVKLSEKPSFEALLYTWGGKGAGQSITLDGVDLPVFENLEAVLRRLRRPTKSCTLWIDAICINQDDLEERASQVKLMRDVYEGAIGVTIWLGEPSRGAELELYGKTGGLGTETALWFSPSTDRLRNGLEKDEIRELMCRPWWSRVWIIEEAVVSRKLKILCGSWEIEWDTLDAETKEENISVKQVALIKVMHPELLSFADSTLDDINTMRRKRVDAKTGNNIYELLYNLRRLACTDPRDRIFAFLGLLSSEMGMILSPDYKRSIGDIYTRFCRAVILKARTLDILNCTREWRGVTKPVTNSRVYSVYERARHHDTAGKVQAEGDSEPSGGAVKLPVGWERCIDGGVVTYFDHNTQTRHNESPMAGKVHPWASRLERQTCPKGCQKTRDNLDRPSIKFDLDEKESPPSWSEDEFPGLPSWVPNWAARTSQDPKPFLDWSKKIDDHGPFQASVYSYAEISPDLDSEVLSLTGLEFDTIEEIASPWHRWGIPELEQWTTLASQDHPTCPYGGQEGRLEAIWRTHIGDYPGEGAVPASDRVFVELWFDKEGWVSPVEIEPMDSFDAGGSGDATHASRLLYEAWRKINGKGKFFNKLREMWDVWAVGRQYLPYLERLYNTCAHRALFVTSKGYIGLAPWNAQAGDKICLLSGGKTPFLLRESKNDDHNFVGECYVYGIMGGEAWAGRSEKSPEKFHIC
ncbi:HET-domain-containing protein [Hypoxylon cercidicola]|nr:HET-domain-containing protein [Hypoxylon cercidicola]